MRVSTLKKKRADKIKESAPIKQPIKLHDLSQLERSRSGEVMTEID